MQPNVSNRPTETTLCNMTLKNARLCIGCDLVLDDIRCEKCGSTMLIALHSLIKPDELRAEIAFAQLFGESSQQLPKGRPS